MHMISSTYLQKERRSILFVLQENVTVYGHFDWMGILWDCILCTAYIWYIESSAAASGLALS